MMSKEAFPSCISSTDLLTRVGKYMSNEELEKVNQAYLLAEKAHDGEVRKSGEPYIFHPIAVAYTLAELLMDVDTVCAAILHDVVEDTDYTKDDIAERFGDVVADLVDGVTKLSGGQFNTREAAAAASFQKMMKVMVRDYRVVLIKLADRLHNVKTLAARSPSSRRRIAKETLDIHVHLAQRMGMNTLRKDLQLNAFRHLYPWRAARLEKVMHKIVVENATEHQEIIETIKQALADKHIEGDVFSWKKNSYKLYERISQGKGHKQLNKFTESLELRVVVNNSLDCYTALGVVHQLFQHKPNSLKDFIAIPKRDGLQTLQTELITPQRQLISVRIQSNEMHQFAQYGITAPKRFPGLSQSSGKSQMCLNRWLAQVEEIQNVTGTPAEFLEDIKADLLLDEIYVSTPRGEIKVLPKGSTPVDFAYAIHTEVGDKCVAAEIDGEPARLNTRLTTGVTVLILTDNNSTPNPTWINFVASATARSSIRSWVNKRKSYEFIELGQKILDKTLLACNRSFDSIPDKNIRHTLSALNLENTDALFISIANGNQAAKLVAKRLLDNDELAVLNENSKDQLLLIKGTEGLVVNLQKCCYPIPGDGIVAYSNKQTGLEIHRDNCPSLMRTAYSSQKNTFSITWVDDRRIESHFLAALNLQVRNHVGVLSHITNLLEKMNINIEDININGDNEMKDMYFLIQVRDGAHLRLVVESLKSQSHVRNVVRVLDDKNR